jgi:hypothetical protein
MHIVLDVENILLMSQKAAEGRTSHNNVWNGVNGMASYTWKHVFDMFDPIPLLPFQALL